MREAQRIRQKLTKICGEAFRVGNELLDAAGQRIGAAQAVDGHAVDRFANRFRVPVGRQPVVRSHAGRNLPRSLGKDGGEVVERRIELRVVIL